MLDQPTPEIELLRAAYAAFNARDIDAALALMTPDVHWPRAFKGGFVRGPEEVRTYWTEQWSEIKGHVEPVAFHLEEDGQVLVEVHQVVRDLTGAVIADEHVGHRFTIAQGLIQAGQVLVEVHQVVRDLTGAVIADEHVGHRFTIAQGLIQAMEVYPLSSSGLGA